MVFAIMNENITLSRYHVGAGHSECLRSSDSSVVFHNKNTGIKKLIIDKDGTICDFPGIEYCKQLVDEMGSKDISPTIKYEASFKHWEDGRLIMLWTARPDGRYWMDSWGFGAEDYDRVCLYSFIGENGEFTSPFKLYSIGSRSCCDETQRNVPDEK